MSENIFMDRIDELESKFGKISAETGEVIEQTEENDDGNTEYYRGFYFEFENSHFYILGSASKEYVALRYPYSLTKHLSNRIDIEKARELVEDSGEDFEEEELKEEAATELLRTIQDEELEQLEFHLSERLTSSEVEYDISHKEGLPTGFQVETLLFPYEGSIRLSTLYDELQAVNAIGKLGSRFLASSFNLSIDSGTDGEDKSFSINLAQET